MRIRGAKTELEEAGLETEGMVESTATLRAEIEALSGVDIMEADGKTFKSTYAILDELAKKWKDLSDIQQATVTELIAGKRQGNIVSSLMTNFDTAREALDTSLNSSGSAMKEHEKWQQSLEAQINKLKASWQSLSQAFLSSDFLKVAFDFVIKLVDGITLLIDKVGVLPTLLTGFSIFKSFGNKGLFKIFNNDLDGFTNKIGIANKSFRELLDAFQSGNKTGGINGFFDGLKSMGDALINPLSKIDLSAIDSYNKLIDAGVESQEAFAKTMSGTSNAAQNLVQSANGGKVALNGMKTASIGAKVGLIGAKVAAIAFNAALTIGISLLIDWAVSGIMKLVNAKKELAESVDEITSKFKEQSDELKKLKGDYDTTNESSMISKYEKLSKGVDNLGRNVSLTADEYSEYQSIVNQIAEQIPSLVSGYDSQGNALLSCKGNVEELTEAYEKLIHAQNQTILTSAGDIEKDYANTIKKTSGEGAWSDNHGFWAGFANAFDIVGLFSENYDLKSDTAKRLKSLLETTNESERTKIYDEFLYDDFSREELRTALERANVDIGYFDNPVEVLKETLKTDSATIKGIVDNFYGQFDEAIEKKKSIAKAKLSEAFDISSAISGLNYGNISEDLQAVAYQVVNSLDKDFFDKLDTEGKSIADWTTGMLDQLQNINKDDVSAIEAAFDLQTQFNGGEVSYGEYVEGLENTGKLIDKLDLDPELESQLKLSIGLDEDGLVAEYHQLRNRLASDEYFDIMPAAYASFIESLSAEEISVLWSIIPELEQSDYKERLSDIKAALEKEMMLQGLTFDLNLEVEATGLEALNTALAESVSATGLSSESIAALKGRYADLEAQGFDLSVMFEETSHGVRLNREEFNKLENAYATDKLAKIDGELGEMKNAYDDLGQAIKNTDDPVKKAELYNDRQTLAKRISEAATLAAQYKGLTSAYNDWLAAEEAGQERDMYEKIIEGFENVDDEIKRGWIDDGTIEFLELLTGRTDLAGKSGKQLKEIYDGLDKTIGKSGYSIRDFFTVNEDGESTNTGVYNFLETVESFEDKLGDVINRDGDGNIIGFDFEVAGGDEVIAETLGVSEELVQIMLRAADDAGFVVTMDGTYKQLADLQNEARAAADYLKEIGKTDVDFDFNTTSVENLKTQLEDAHKILDDKDFWNEDGTFNFDADGATQAMQIVSTLQAKLDKLTAEQYGIGLTVEDEQFEEPLENLQEYGRTVQTLNQLKLNPKANAEEIKELEGDLKEISEYFANLDGETKVKLGLDADDNWEEVKTKIENGEVKIPTVLDIQANMDKNIETLTDLALLNSGLLSADEEETIRKKYKVETEVEYEPPKNTSSFSDSPLASDGFVGALTNDQQILRDKAITRKANIQIIADTMGVEDVGDLSTKLKDLDDKTIQAIAEVIGQIDVEKLKQTLALIEPKKVEAIAEAIGQGDVDGLRSAIKSLDPKTVQAIAEALGYSDVNELDGAIENLDPKTVQAVAEALGITDVDSLKGAIDNLQPKTVEVSAETSGESKVSGLKSLIDSIKSKTVTITSWFKKIFSGGSTRNDSNGFSDVNGTANVNGTTSRAFARGNWGTKNSGTALVGELGTEVLVRDGQYYTIGDNGAEFIKYKKGDIIFNHVQARELFSNGKVTSGGGRGKALVDGTAFSSGSGGIGKVKTPVKKSKNKTTTKTTTKKNKNTTTTTTITATSNDYNESISGSSGSGGTDKVEGSAVGTQDKFEETFDWIAIAIERIEREIDNLDKTVGNVYKSWGDRNAALASEIDKVSEEIALQNDAATEYLNKANAVGLDESWAKKVRDGTLDISTVTDEDTAEKIKEYQNWYNLYLKCTDAAEDLKQTEAKLYAQHFENVQAQYDSILQGFAHTETMLNEYISQAEAKGHIVSKNYYQALQDNKNAEIDKLKEEQAALIAQRDAAVESGTIEKYSEEWYNMCADIDSVTQAIESGTTALIGYDNAMRDIDWQVFDLIQERISDVTSEANFLIDLMSNEKLFDDNGKLTDKGMATMGLHGQNYNTYMYQADEYAKEIANLDTQIAADPYDQALIKRRRELVKLQRESILAAEDEKQAIVDLVEEGINLELEALQERIDLHNEELDSMKD